MNSKVYVMAEREGFEPSIRCRIHTFQACAFDHSAISPGMTFTGVTVKRERI